MKFWAGILSLLLLASPPFAGKTSVTIDGTTYINLQDVHVGTGGRIIILYDSGGTTTTPDKVPKSFLTSWGITDADIAASKATSRQQTEELFAQAVRAGYFREVNGTVYDLRKAQPGWRHFTDAKILSIVEGGALVDPSPSQYSTAEPVYVRRLPHIFADNERATFMARATGQFSYVNKYLFEHTIHAYDVGRVCKRNEIPDAIVYGGQASAAATVAFAEPALPSTPPPRYDPPDVTAPRAGHRVHGIGSGFFITSDGYLVTNFHVVKDAHQIEVKYKNDVFPAKVVELDTVNDLALVKVSGSGFGTVALSRKDSADLGDEVFTIGFPNISMQGLEPKFTDGRISSLAGMQDDPSEYQISVPVQPGNSGGPLCDSKGEVVGIVVARLNDMAALRESGAVPQNVNYAVKAKLAVRLIQKVNGLDSAVSSRTPNHSAKPVPAVENAIGMVMVY